MSNKIRIGTRGSQLALYQANYVKERIEKLIPNADTELVIIKTKGDKILDVALSKIGDKGLFTKELEVALSNHKIDIAVHSLKDMPTKLPEGMHLAAVSDRGTVPDALVSIRGKKLNELDENDVVATSSLRRRASLLRYNPNLKIVDIRGNMNTRLEKMKNGHCTAMIMAATGLERLELQEHISDIIPLDIIIPAASQGVIGIESLEDNAKINDLMQQINHQPTWNSIVGERAFLRTIEGGCQVPAGCFTQITGSEIKFKAFISSIDGKNYLTHTVNGPIDQSEQLGCELGKYLLQIGGKEILNEIRAKH
ncbi:MAG: hydroxymethylbilane synthase [Bacteroidales bacterium]|nr:hydroxymethylbilane synthase [Bacteroidales bacterium]